jgi:CDP-diglyceride synthetase
LWITITTAQIPGGCKELILSNDHKYEWLSQRIEHIPIFPIIMTSGRKAEPNQQGEAISTQPSSSTTTTSVWSDIPRRLFTICVGVPAIWKMLQQPTLAYIFFMGAHALCAWEFTLLEPSTTPNNKFQVSTLHRICFSVVSVFLASAVPHHDALFFFLLALIAGTFVMMHRMHWLTGLLLVTIPFRSWAQIQLRSHHDAFINSVSLLLVVWNADTGAMLMGRIAGIANRRYPSWKRWPIPKWILRISPKKSMEGFVGGILGGVWTAVQWIPCIVHWASPTTSAVFDSLWITSSWKQRAALGATLSILAIVGDLVESSIKRQSQAKDSGSILPGHGGILDRFDSSLLAVLCYQVVLLNHQTTTG